MVDLEKTNLPKPEEDKEAVVDSTASKPKRKPGRPKKKQESNPRSPEKGNTEEAKENRVSKITTNFRNNSTHVIQIGIRNIRAGQSIDIPNSVASAILKDKRIQHYINIGHIIIT